ncbi:helix-turn-helix domain-containing protein [Selenomonas sp. oral taxon 138]|uniref:helix-turn-helix domain-containing protein n=1 Tax=Selenomonas sp. oral taxon 138 TaxID=712532 RepID=UPI0002A35374|nr:helix-turn-helix domain-containing protein [Selenomonas sp. oral taxon 138]EKX98074.1 DNA-binding helix-turn-helix protein [Selenomonas sp. oral taxon 138 str. F0429]
MKTGVELSAIRAKLMKNEAFAAEYERLQPRYELIAQIIAARTGQNMTQSELARRMGTQTSNISRLESGTYNPSLDFLIRTAHSLGKELQIALR